MKWFKHDCDMHTDLKIQSLMEKYGLEGYAIWNLFLEMIGKEGKKGKIESQLRWREGLMKIIGWSDNSKLNNIINYMGELNLICSKSLKYGNLYIPKFIKRADDYTLRQLRTNSEQTPNKLHVDKIRIDKIILHYIAEKGWEESIKTNPSLQTDIFKRNVRGAKQLLIVANDDEIAKKTISAMAKEYKEKNLSWTLETVIKHFAEFSIQKPKVKYV